LNQAITRVINAYAQLPLQRVWGSGKPYEVISKNRDERDCRDVAAAVHWARSQAGTR
jgi:hypothetical protein